MKFPRTHIHIWSPADWWAPPFQMDQVCRCGMIRRFSGMGGYVIIGRHRASEPQ